jgi:hypothetical protein
MSPRRTTDISVNEQLLGSSAEFTQTRRSSPAWNTARFTAGSSVAVVANQASPRSAGSKPRSRTLIRPASRHARTSSPSRGATTVTSAPAARRVSILRAAIRPAPTTTQRRPRTSRLTG